MNDHRVKFKFHPANFESQLHAVEKSNGDGAAKRRYLIGVSSGERLDGQGERMTAKCIKSFMTQCNSGSILLYADKHDVNFTDDIGILVGAEILPDGDWKTTFRLFDDADGFGPNTVERANKIWRQVKGIPPYTHPIQKGFSVEGYIPEGGIVEMSPDGRRVMDEVVLDGVVVVPRPAYSTSIAHAVYKALGLKRPWTIQKGIAGRLRNRLSERESANDFYSSKYALDDALMDEVYNFMNDPTIDDRREVMKSIMEEYGNLMCELVVDSRVFKNFNDDSLHRVSKSPEDERERLVMELLAKLRKINDALSITQQENYNG
jgi:hypothetical protein